MSDVLADWRSLQAAAEEAAATAPSPVPGDLWARGQRTHRRRQRGTLAIVTMATALLLAMGSWGWQRQASPQPADRPAGEVGLPDRIYPVPKWLPVGTLGSPALAVTSVEHGTWRGTETRVAAISATTGEYVVLNIPANTTDDDEVVLSPDGRYLAYWTAGTPTGDPNTSDGQEDPTTGVTVYGLVTGKQVAHHEIASEHGVIPTSLLWADATTLVFGYGQWAEGDTGDNPGLAWQKDDRAFTWSLGDTPERLQLPGVSGIDSTFSEAQDGVVLTGSRLIDLNRNTSQKIRVPASPGNTGPGGGSGDLRGDGVYTTIGGPGLPPQTPNKVTLTKIGSSGSTTKPRVVPGTSGTIQVLGWRSDRLVLTRWLRGDRAEIQAVDVETGEHEVLARTPRRGSGSLWQWAEDLLEAEVVPGREPPSPVDPRLLLGWIVAVIAATGTALVYWRRRVRA